LRQQVVYEMGLVFNGS